MISECIYKSRIVFLTSKKENYLDSYLSNFYIKDQNEKILFFSHGKIKFYKTDEFENDNKILVEHILDIQSICSYIKDLFNVGNKFDYILVDRIDLLVVDKTRKERKAILDDLFLLASDLDTQIIISLVNEDPSLLMNKICKFNYHLSDLIYIENIKKDLHLLN